MSTETVSKLRIKNNLVTVTLKADKSCLSLGNIITVEASFSQKGKNLGSFVTSECVIATPVGGSLEILDVEETGIPSDGDSGLSMECYKKNKYFTISQDDAIIQASGIFISQDKSEHHIITDPLLIKIRNQTPKDRKVDP